MSVRAWPSQLWWLNDCCGLKNEALLFQMDSKYPPTTPPRLDLRKGVTDPVVLMISRRQVEQQDLASVLDSLKVFTATREDAWLYRGQMRLVVDVYNHDPRELVDIPEVRHFLKRLAAQWPYWGFFLNQVDDSIKILGSCCCGVEFPGRGAVLIDPALLPGFLSQTSCGIAIQFQPPQGRPRKSSIRSSKHLGAESGREHDACSASTTPLNQTCTSITGHQVIGLTRQCHGKQKNIVRIVQVHVIRGRWQIDDHNGTLHVVDHGADTVGWQDGLEFWVAAHASQLLKLSG